MRMTDRIIIALVGLILLNACSSQQHNAGRETTDNLATDAVQSANLSQGTPAIPLPPLPNYNSKDGNTYMYVSAVSHEDQEKGRATGDVVMFRYLGQSDGLYRLAILDDSERQIAVAECQNPCAVITERFSSGRVSRVGFSQESIIGSAFADAFNGFLETASGSESSTTQGPGRIPPQFVGEWNVELADCGTDNNDSRLVIEPRSLRFYESVGEIQSLSQQDSRTLVIRLRLSGEGQTWNDTMRLILSPSGQDLRIGDLTRHHCHR